MSVAQSGDVLRIAGFQNATSLAASIRYEIAYRRGLLSRLVSGKTKTAATVRDPRAARLPGPPISITDVDIFAEQHPRFVEGSNRIKDSHELRRFGPVSVWGWAAGHIADLSEDYQPDFWLEVLYEFAKKVETGADLGEGSPALALRRRMLAPDLHNLRKLGSIERAGLIVKAWNAHARGQEIKLLRWSTGEGFPTVSPDSGGIQGSES